MLTNNKFKACMLAVVLLFTLTSAVGANFSARTIALGDQFVTLTGVDALYGNPAAVNADPDFFTLELSGGAEAWNNLLRNDYIKEEEKDDLIKKIKNRGGFLIGAEGRGGAKLAVGPAVGFLDLKANGLVSLSPDAAAMLLDGNEIGKEYNLEGSSGAGGVYADGGVNISLASPQDLIQDWEDVEDLYVGFTYHQLAGVIARGSGEGSFKIDYKSDEAGADFTTEGGRFRVEYNNPDEGLATGSAVDLGAYANLDEKYSIGVSVMNLGALTADAGSTYYMDYEAQYDDAGNFEDFKESDEEPLDSTLKWQLPTTYRLGGNMKYTEDVILLADYSYTTYYSGEDYSEHKFATAAEMSWFKFLPLRTGFNYSTQQGFNWSGGLGLYLGPVKADLGISNILGLFNKSKKLEAGLTAKIEF